jgi:hypothetical protein
VCKHKTTDEALQKTTHQEAEIRRTAVQGQPRKKFARPHLNLGHLLFIPATEKSGNRRVVALAGWGIKQNPNFKNNQSK